MKKSKTRKQYVEYLNTLSPPQGKSDWIIGGTIRFYYMWSNQYGQAIRKYDPIGFEVGYNEWCREYV